MPLSTELFALGQILMIDITLAGDNAIVVGMAAVTVPKHQRRRVIVGGIAIAVLLRVLLAGIARQMLTIIGLTLSGGLLLLWVAWKLYRQLAKHEDSATQPKIKHQSMLAAMIQIAVADISMSLDNVLAVAGAAVGHPTWVLAGGLALAIVLMAFAAGILAKLMHHLPWIAYLGLMVVVFVASRMIWIGSGEVIRATL